MLQTVTENQNSTKLAYSVEELAKATTFSKAYIRNEIRDGNLKAKRQGRRVLILRQHAEEYLNGFADAKPKNEEK